MAIQSSMQLGVVTINNQRYMAILHFRTAEGQERPITDAIAKAKNVCLQRFIEVTKLYADNGSNSLIGRVTQAGFVLADKSVLKHEDLKSQEAWNKLIQFLENPELEVSSEDDLEEGSQVGLIPMEGIIGHELEIAEGIHNKLGDDSLPFPRDVQLDEKEIRFLRLQNLKWSDIQYKDLLQGKLTQAEFNRFNEDYDTLLRLSGDID